MSTETFIEYHSEREATLNVLRIDRCKSHLIFFELEGEQCFEVF